MLKVNIFKYIYQYFLGGIGQAFQQKDMCITYKTEKSDVKSAGCCFLLYCQYL